MMNLPLVSCCLGMLALAAAARSQEAPASTAVTVRARYTPVRMKPDGAGVVVAGDAVKTDKGSVYWVWKADADGQLRWKFSFPADRQEEIKDLAVTRGGGVEVLGSLFVYEPHAAFRTWVRGIDWSGKAGEPVTLESDGHPAVLLLPNPDALAIGGARHDEANLENNTYDVWMAQMDATGVVAWQKHLDSGAHERILAGHLLRDGSIVWVASANTRIDTEQDTDRFWLIDTAPDGVVQGQTTVEKTGGIIGHGTHLLEGATGLGLVVSDASGEQSEGHSATLMVFDPNLRMVGRKQLAGFSSTLTPVLALTASNEWLVVGATAQGPRVTALAADGAVLWENTVMAPDAGQPQAMNVADAVVIGDQLWIVGMTAPVLQPDITEQVYLLKYSLSAQRLLWIKTYF